MSTRTARWQRELADAIRDVPTLLTRLGLDASDLDADPDPSFPLRVPEPYLARIRPRDPADPLLRQVLPLAAERGSPPGYVADPLHEAAATRAPGLIQKYAGRALLVAAPACAVHCRYCFRRAFPYDDHNNGPDSTALDVLAADRSIREVILSGGDPLVLKDGQLAALIEKLAAMDHLQRVRIHTRVPVVIPSRVTEALVAMLAGTRLTAAVVLHVNHPNEIDAALIQALGRLAEAQVQLLNQSVLLAGVNDDADTLAELSERLFAAGVLPYYLHLPDRVVGTHHFAVSEARGRELLGAVQRRLSGYLVPTLAREIPGEPSKRWLGAI